MKPKAIVDRLEILIGVDGPPQKLTVAIESLLVNEFGFSSLEAAVQAEESERAVCKLISDRATTSESEGIVYPLHIVGSVEDIVAGFCYELSYDQPAVILAKRRRREIENLLQAIKALTFGEFERFSAKILKLIGASSSHVTPHAGDQGIDFYGILSLGQFNALPEAFMRLAHDVKLSFAGQSKHYPTRNLSPNVVRELVGAVSLARSGTFSSAQNDLFVGANFRPFSPIVILLFTSGGVSSGARQLALEAGIVVKSGEQLAVFLADHGVGFLQNNGGSSFSKDEFLRWVRLA